MSDLFTSKRLILLLLALMLFSALIGFTSSERKPTGWPVALVQDGVALFQSWFHKPARVVAGFFQDLREWKMLYDENQALKANLDQYARMSAELARLREENQRLRAMLDLRSTLDTFRLYAAEVIARSPDQWNQVLVINKGARDGIRPDMAVITTKGLIGRVTDVTPFTARVALLTDLSRSGHVSAVVQGEESRVFGVIDAYD
ncbi:MAG: rod shape-determining protein MreC, partial [Calditerricola sp.]|nr:rod shape-determining protein MreC [Calditerricola sp.]